MHPVVLDLDGSVGPLENRVVIPMSGWCDALRYACTKRTLRTFASALDVRLPIDHGTVFTGSGDFHHISFPLIERAARHHRPMDVVVIDNHPDNMRFPFGIHCGSWVRFAAMLEGVAHVHVAGITSTDVGVWHAWENRLRPLLGRRLTYWSTGVDVGWAERLGLGDACRSFDSMAALGRAFIDHMARSSTPVYLSIDKDVLSPRDARTNWDQGHMREHELMAMVSGLHGRIVASDVTGDVSVACYRSWWKRALSRLDGQLPVPSRQLEQWQRQQHLLNGRLIKAIDRSTA